ncbi:hypothetical protein [Leucobacter luti]|nr:hypothetical protein [Leucobacter luti]
MNITDETETLLWAMRPAIDLSHLRGPLPSSISDLAPEKRPFRPATHLILDSFFVATETVNQARALERVAHRGVPIELDLPGEDDRARLFGSPALALAQRRIAETLNGRVPAAVIDSFENQLYKVVVALSIYRGFDLSRFSGVLVSTQHSPIMRALFIAAEEQGVPVIYVPHAPVAVNSAYRDLPVAYAGLRGPGEVEFYARELAVPRTQLDIVGNLGSDVLSAPMPSIDPASPGVVALSPHPAETIRRVFAAVSSPQLGATTVAPHPRSDLPEVQALMPSGWRIDTEHRTLDLLHTGVPFMFQLSSGVAWESAALGIPTATIRLDESPVNYPFLDDEAVFPSVFTPADAAAFVADARAGRIDRAALRKHAVHWCALDGASAAAELERVLAHVATGGAQAHARRLHDGWAAGGAALAYSSIAHTPVAPS